MSNDNSITAITQQLLNRLAAGDNQAREVLISHSMERLRRLARKMLRGRPAVHRWDDTDDVLQNSLLRLNRALKTVSPESPQRFIGLAATQIRRELIDLHRHHYGPLGNGAHHVSDPGKIDSQGNVSPIHEESDSQMSPAEQAAFHESIDSLPSDLKDVFEMSFYAGMTQEEIAETLGLSSKTIKRRWRDARLSLQKIVSQNDEE